ncbi:MAG: hypothetical protein ABSE71_01505 [Candidatus Micrarchaeaceae archaeon]|jgi:hypothetical protein
MATKDNESDSRRYNRLIRTAGMVVALGVSIAVSQGNGSAQVWSEKAPIGRNSESCMDLNRQGRSHITFRRDVDDARRGLQELTASDSEFKKAVFDSYNRPLVVGAWSRDESSKDYLTVVNCVSGKYMMRMGFAVMDYEKMSYVPSLQSYFGKSVMEVPTTFFVYRGRILDAKAGVMSEPELREWLDKNMRQTGQ